MGMLADSINLPLVFVWGLAVFVPLTLFVVSIECLVLRWRVSVPFRKSFGIVLLANVLSTVAGWAVYGTQGAILGALGLRMMQDFARHYWWAALILIAMYYLKSAAVEGLVIARRRVAEPLGLTRGRLWAGVFAANAASYLFVGPLFYFTTRPTFEGVHLLSEPAQVVSCQDPIYYTDKEKHLWVVNADGKNKRPVSTRTVEGFWLSADRKALIVEDSTGSLWARLSPDADPTAIGGTAKWGIEFSSDGQRVALCLASEVIGKLRRWSIGVVDLNRGTTIAEMTVEGYSAVRPDFCWDARTPDLLWCLYDSKLAAYRLGEMGLARVEHQADVNDYVMNYHGKDRPFWETTDVQGDLKLLIWPGLGAYMEITRGDDTVMRFRDDRGILGLSLGGPWYGAFLSAPGEIAFEAEGHVWVGNATTKSIAPLVEGTYQRIVPNDHHELVKRAPPEE